MAIKGSTVCQSSLNAADAPAGSVLQGIREEGEEDFYLLEDYDPEGHDRESHVRRKIGTRRRKNSLRSRLFPWSCAHRKCESRLWSKSALFCGAVRRPFWILVAILGLVSLFSFSWDSLLTVLAESRDAGIFPGQQPSLFSDWLTHGVIPIACHSHNDYWRRVPLFSALAVGCTSVEADIWLDGDELRVGHTMRTIIPNQSLRSLYIDPLLDILEHHNPARNVSTSETESSVEPDDLAPVGVFVTEPTQSLVLLIDFKTSPELLWPLLMENLQPLRQKGYLTHFNGTTLIQRPITVVATGSAPFHRIQASTTYRDIFYDAPLDKLTIIPLEHELEPEFQSTTNYTADTESSFTKYNSYYASVNFHASIGSLPLGRLSQDQLAKIRDQIAAAHARGLKVRYWGTPGWPVGLRNYVWRVLVREGVDMLNVDDLRAASRVDWRAKGWWG
ncbi:Altered inheritance of mitochondria protein 6 [Penicillium rolfsii]|nr:Altered inheritance of mitochondria protein 6 [Penicillium rolfsii]